MRKKQLSNAQYPMKQNEVKKLLDSCLNIRDRLIIELMAFAGLRRGETAGLRVQDIDLASGRLNVLGKGDRERTIPVDPKLIQSLVFFLCGRKRGPVFLAKRRDSEFSHIGPDTINTVVAKAGNLAKLKNPNPRLKHINPHALRHFYARTLKGAGVRIETIAALMGHADIKTTLQEYGNQDIEDIQKELAAIW